MANSLSAKKRIRQANKHRAHNRSRRSEMRTMIKKFLKSVMDKDVEQAKSDYRAAVSLIDRIAHIRAIHRNAGNRLKSRLNAKLKAIS